MRIEALKIRNFKNIENLELSELPQLVVIAGPNGSGKTATFDAIRILKESIAGYSVNNPGGVWVDNLLQPLSPVVSVGQELAEIDASISVSAVERETISLPDEHSGVLRAVVRVAAATATQRERAVPEDANGDLQYLRLLLGGAYSRHGTLGVLDHIGPDRRFNPTQVGSISFSNAHAENELQRLVLLSHDKFSGLAEDLVWMHVVDLQEQSKGTVPAHNYIEGVREIFRHFLPDKEFLGVEIPVDLSGPPQIRVHAGGIEHDINQLSSGQREILMTYTHLEKLRPSSSIILFDEPELHLHPALQRRVIAHLQHLLDRGNNQIWAITHSEEIVGSTPYESLYSMTGRSNPAITPVRVRAAQIELLQQLGASVAIQLTSPRILFLEGESDADLLPLFFESLPASLSLVNTNGKGNLMRLAPAAMQLVEQTIVDGQFYMVRDKDVEDEPEKIDGLQRKFDGHFFTWDRYHIENYLLDESAIAHVLSSDPDLRNMPDATEVGNLLKQYADQRKSEVIAKHIEAALNSQLRVRLRLNPKEDLRESLIKAAESRSSFTAELLELQAVDELYNRVADAICSRWGEEWRALCIGRSVLQDFHFAIVRPHLGYEVFRNRIARTMREMGLTPLCIQQVIDAVSI